MANVERSGGIGRYKFNLDFPALAIVTFTVGFTSLQYIAYYRLAGIARDKEIDEPRARDFNFIDRFVDAYLLDNQLCQIAWRPGSLLCQQHRNIAGKITLLAIPGWSHLNIRRQVDRQLLRLLKARKRLLDQIVDDLFQNLKPVLIAAEK